MVAGRSHHRPTHPGLTVRPHHEPSRLAASQRDHAATGSGVRRVVAIVQIGRRLVVRVVVLGVTRAGSGWCVPPWPVRAVVVREPRASPWLTADVPVRVLDEERSCHAPETCYTRTYVRLTGRSVGGSAAVAVPALGLAGVGVGFVGGGVLDGGRRRSGRGDRGVRSGGVVGGGSSGSGAGRVRPSSPRLRRSGCRPLGCRVGGLGVRARRGGAGVATVPSGGGSAAGTGGHPGAGAARGAHRLGTRRAGRHQGPRDRGGVPAAAFRARTGGSRPGTAPRRWTDGGGVAGGVGPGGDRGRPRRGGRASS